MAHYDEQREQDYADRLSKSRALKEESASIEWDALEEIERLNQGSQQLRTIRSRFSRRAINVLGDPARVITINHNGNTGEHYFLSGVGEVLAK